MAQALPMRSPDGARVGVLAGFTFVGAVVQLLAAVVLELASPRALDAARAQGAFGAYLLLAFVAVAVLGARLLKERPGAALAFGVGTLALGVVYLRTRVASLTLAAFLEPIAYHFVALTSAALAIMVASSWVRSDALRQVSGKWRWVPWMLGALGTTMLLAEHLSDALAWLEGPTSTDTWRAASRATALGSWSFAIWVLWRAARPSPARWLPLMATALIVTRIVAAGPRGLIGETVVGGGATIVGTVFVLVALATAVCVRPRIELAVHVVVGVASLAACMLFLWLYYRAYGNVEDGLGDVLRSLFAFDVPLPYGQHPGWWKPAVVMVGIFFLLYTVYAAIVSTEQRVRGLALAMMALAGLNLASPYLVLLLTAGGMLYVDTLVASPGSQRSGASQGADSPALENELRALAERLGFDAPLTVDAGRGRIWALHGTLDGVPVDLRARQGGRDAGVELTAGVLGSEHPLIALLWDPGTHGQRPAHAAASEFRVEGELRHLEALGDRPLDALRPFTGARMQWWEAGVLVELEAEDPALTTDRLEALMRAATRGITNR